ncbi:UDP-N-acetylmuramate dehydrogenase [Schaalia suimastitidis]|uniref:UDP-N-acetylmuramate dehydrogenase n=1 Tax=Schaalia suimastitidis TaxID=121163 RepID=UPI000422B03F|nr:UDP-N-acetylmuramate dehydrogenase [Schaalia suimastitidis]
MSIQIHTAVALSTLTTLRVGGQAARLIETDSRDAFIDEAARADAAGIPLLVLGGGSNLLASDSAFDGVVLRDLRSHITTATSGNKIQVTATAGTTWDDLVTSTLEQGLAGLEALSGIPGTVGAAPVQNVGAYGCEVADTLHSIRAWDRAQRRLVTLTAADLALSYRSSRIKRSVETPDSAGHIWGPTGRWIVLDVTFTLKRAPTSAPVRYGELARALDVEVGHSADAWAVRDAVVRLRASKGMVLDAADYDTWSAGSFFTNPLLTPAEAATLPPEAPRFAAGGNDAGLIKTSAAWLIDHAGCPKGWAPDECLNQDGTPRASLSTKHVLALTNRGSASARDIEALARAVRAKVRDCYGITLVPEPVALGINWD